MEYLVVSLMFIVFLQTRFVELRRATLCLALQSALIAAACLVVGMSHGSGLHAWLPGVLTIAVKVLFIPYAILRVVNQLRDEREIVSDINVNHYADDRSDYLGKRHLPARPDYDRRLAADYRAGHFP